MDLIPFVTIDEPSTRDLDDAIWVGEEDGSYVVKIAIADPTALVRIGDPIDVAARQLGATVYAGDRTVKRMLPKTISEEASSLTAGIRRQVMLYEIVIDRSGEVRKVDVGASTVVVASRLSYADVPLILRTPDHAAHAMLIDALAVAELLLALRRSKGAMVLYDLSLMLFMDEEGRLRRVS